MTTNERRRMRRTRLVLGLAPALAMLAAGCTAGGAGNNAAGAQSIVVAFKHEVNTLDPAHADYAMTNLIDITVYEPLVRFDPTSNNLVGQLASSFTVAPDATSVAFTLRDGVTFHDGSPLTADDVKYSLDRYVAIGQGVASNLANYASTTVTDPTHLTINLKKPDAYFTGSLSNVYILSKALVSKNAGTDNGQGWLQSHDAGTGPFQTNGQPASDGATVTRFDKYWQFDPKRPTGVTFRRIDESATERDELKAGNVDVALGLSAADAASLKDAAEVTFLKTAGQTQVVFNTSQGPTANPVVRRAIQLGYDYDGGLAKILNGNGTIASGLLSDQLSCRPAGTPSRQDQAAAKQLLQQAGQTNLTLSLKFQPADVVQTQLATLMQSNLKEIGVTVNLVPVAFPDYLKSLGSPATIPEMMLLNDYAKTPDPGQTLNNLYSSSTIGSVNKTAYRNPDVDALLAKAGHTADAVQRCDLAKQAETLIEKDAPAVNMYQVAFPVAYRKGLTGIGPDWSATPLSVSQIRVG